jgi:cell division protein FtsL
MTALGKLFRTTAFKLTLVYLTTFVLFAAVVLVYFGWNTRRLINEQITQTVDSEIVTLQDEYDIGGIRRLIFTLDARARRPDRDGLSQARGPRADRAPRAGQDCSAVGWFSHAGRARSRRARPHA